MHAAAGRLQFTLEATASGSSARAARFTTRHNEVLTPTFMPVGTHAAVRSQRREDLLESGAQVLLANTYHLLLRPGVELFEKFGGIHGFMNWPRSVLTDSGGFQIFSLPGSRTMREEYAEFKSYVDKTLVRLSPERSIETQRAIGSDIMMVLDQCVPSTVEHGVARSAMELTHRWAQRSLAARGESEQALFGIVQGASYTDLRVESARAIAQMPFDGYAIGGLAVGESSSQREDCTATVTELLPNDSPRYLMGVGTTRDLLEAVHRGVDMFDCILPTSLAKQGVAFTSLGRRDLRRAAYRGMQGPIDPACDCYTCKTYSIAYLFNLQRVHETTGWQLLGLHNVNFYMRLMRTMREHILSGTWLPFYQAQRDLLDARDSYGKAATHVTKAALREAKRKFGRGHAPRGRSGARSTLALRRAVAAHRAPASSVGPAAGSVGRGTGGGGQCDGRHPRGRILEFCIRGSAARARELRERPGFTQARSAAPPLVQTPAARSPAGAVGGEPLDQRCVEDRMASVGRRLRREKIRRAIAGHHLLRPILVQDRQRPVDTAGVSRAGASLFAKTDRALYLHLLHECPSGHAGRRLLRRQGPRHRSQSGDDRRSIAVGRRGGARSRIVGAGVVG